MFFKLFLYQSLMPIIEKVLAEGRNVLLEPEAAALCQDYSIPTPRSKLVYTVEEAVAYGESIGYPVVVKIVSQDILHKSDVGCVSINLKRDKEVRDAYENVIKNAHRYKPDVRISGVLVQQMVNPGIETIIGMKTDMQFGPVLMFGLGGIFVEVLKDVSFRVVPITAFDAREMIKGIKAYPLLAGVRGQKPRDVEALVDILLKVSKMVTEVSEIEQLDFNPTLVYEKGIMVVDTRVILKSDKTHE